MPVGDRRTIQAIEHGGQPSGTDPLVLGSCTVNGSGLVSEALFGPRLYHWAMLWSQWIMTAPTRLDDPAYEDTIR